MNGPKTMPTTIHQPSSVRLGHEATAEALQKWLWQCIAGGWKPLSDGDIRWTHDDNMAVQHLGWMIAKPPLSEHFDLFSLLVGVSSASIMTKIVDAAPIDPLCAKAVSLLAAQRLKFPDVKFAFSGG